MNADASVPVVDTPAPVVEQPSSTVKEGDSCLGASTAAAPFVRTVVLVFLTNATVGNSGVLVATIFA